MRVSRAQRAEHGRRILEAAGHLFRARGFDAVSVAEVMAAAGLTHGGFYGHFKSKDDLVAQTLDQLLATDRADGAGLSRSIDAYLSPRHRDNTGGGCPTAGLAADVPRQAAAAQTAMTNGLRAQLDRLTAEYPGVDAEEKRRAAVGTWAAMVGALILARAVDDRALSDEILEHTQRWLGTHLDRASSGSGDKPRRSTRVARKAKPVLAGRPARSPRR